MANALVGIEAKNIHNIVYEAIKWYSCGRSGKFPSAQNVLNILHYHSAYSLGMEFSATKLR